MRSYTNVKRSSPLGVSQKARRKKRNRLIVLGIILLIFGGWGVKLVATHVAPHFKKLSIFQFKKVIVSATEHITETELKALVGRPSGENLFEIDLNSINKRLKKNPWILDVQVSRFFPDRIRIDVIEKEPVVILSMGGLFFLDAQAKKIAPIRPRDRADFPILSGFKKTHYQKREPIFKAYRLIERYKKNYFLSQWPISELHWDKNGYVLFTKKPVFEIRLGLRGFPKKFLRLEKVLKDLSQKKRLPRLIDLNFTKKVVVKLAK